MYLKMCLILMCAWLLAGCNVYARWQLTLAERDYIQQRAEILRLYKDCLVKYEGPQGKAQCEHYTQALHSFDVRGLR